MDERDDIFGYATAMQDARASLRANRLTEGFQRYESILATVRDLGNRTLEVQTLLEFGVHLALHGRVDEGVVLVDTAELIAIEVGFPVDTGDFAFAHGEVLSARGDHAAAIAAYLNAATEFSDGNRTAEFSSAISRHAFEVDFIGEPPEIIAAHRDAIEAVRLSNQSSGAADWLVAIHLGRICTHHLAQGDAIAALGAATEARDLWVRSGGPIDVANADVEIGSLYTVLDLPDLARTHWEQALIAFADQGMVAEAAAVDAALDHLDGPGLDAGPELA